MRSPETILRDAVYSALNGNISVDVFGAKAEPTNSIYVVLEDTTSFEGSDKQNFGNEVVLQMEIVDTTNRSGSYKAVDLIYEEIMEILLPTVNNPGFTVAAGWQAVKVRVESSDFLEQHLEIIARRIIRLRCTMIQY